MAMKFEVREINTHPKDTGVEQYIKVEAVIIQFLPDTKYSKETGDTEIYAGESVGVL